MGSIDKTVKLQSGSKNGVGSHRPINALEIVEVVEMRNWRFKRTLKKLKQYSFQNIRNKYLFTREII